MGLGNVFHNRTCPAENTAGVDQSRFFDSHGVDWDAHRIGWVVAGSTAVATTIITSVHIALHCFNYRVPAEQRQIIRILGMPFVYAVISFFSYRYFRTYNYYLLAETVYEALVIAAFTMLLIVYIGNSTEAQRETLQKKDKRKMVFPLCFLRMRPSKPGFLFALKWSVLQYVFVRPLVSLAGIICEALGKLCPTKYSPFYAEVYLDSIDFISISIALYGLILFYAVTRDDLKGRGPLNKFLSIKGIVFFTFYQGFVFGLLEDYNVIKATQYWTADNVADGLQALCTCCEMVVFSVWMFFSFSWREYGRMEGPRMNPVKAFFHAQNYWDFLKEAGLGIKFLFDWMRGKPGTSSKHQGLDGKIEEAEQGGGFDMSRAFGVGRYSSEKAIPMQNLPAGAKRGMNGAGNGHAAPPGDEIPELPTPRGDVEAGRGGAAV